MRFVRLLMLVAVATLAACGSDDPSTSAGDTTAADPTAAAAPPHEAGDGLYPDVLEVQATPEGDTWAFAVTMSSPYDSPERYADAWRVLAPDGTELGVRVLTHDHAGEQPFTRSLNGVEIPPGITEVTIEGRDQLNGWGGDTVTVTLER